MEFQDQVNKSEIQLNKSISAIRDLHEIHLISTYCLPEQRN